MKMRSAKKRFLLAAFLGLLLILGVLAKEYKEKNFMTLSDAKARWGQKAFDAHTFKSLNAKGKASMVVSLIESKQMIGKPLKSIRQLLGDYSGHYWSGDIPTYIIEEGWETNHDTWQIVFIPDKDRNVKEIKIHKNCCDP